MAKKLKPSQWAAFSCLGIGVIAAIAFYYVWPHATIWGYIIVALIVAGLFYKPLIEIIAHEKMADRDD
jgi:hypothetical protein